MSDILRDIYENYKTWIINNPQKIGDYETLVKWISYFIAGKFDRRDKENEMFSYFFLQVALIIP